ncbi:ABC transporter permease [Actinomadura bangladeshensis]|jgi:ribose transport system permease protein|uniref:ABC transporter permease n=1 Tax=Actinomadura bangladeshensis TaxID=453573 RepID=A0A6L9QSW1_9ACTN|nr:ABC transporter permease [Actinomadura bangladeshensis]NEA28579.1 ABC transporter permease [Actinomadura bangladeshensis]
MPDRLTGVVRGNLDVVGLGALLAVLLAVYSHYDSEVFTPASITILSAQFLPLILAAMGQSTVMLAGGIDLSLGSVLALAMAVFAVRAEDGVLTAAVLALAVAAATGAANGVLVAFAGLPPIIVTLAASFLWGGVTLVVLPKPGGGVPSGLVKAYNNGWNGIALPFVVIVLVLLLWKIVRTTRFGLSLYAVGGNEHGAYASGIATRKVKISAYALAGVFIGLAGIGLAVQTGSGDATIGAPYTLNSIAASVLAGVSFFGGVGQMRATVLAALLIGLLANLLLFTGLSPFYQLIMQGAVLIVAIAVKTFATRERTE